MHTFRTKKKKLILLFDRLGSFFFFSIFSVQAPQEFKKKQKAPNVGETSLQIS